MFSLETGMCLLWILQFYTQVYAQDIHIEQKIMRDISEKWFLVNSSHQYVLIYDNLTSINAFRVKTTSIDAERTKPILIVARQEKQVTAWSIPLLVESPLIASNQSEYSYHTASKTLCHDYMDDIISSPFSFGPLHLAQNFIISLSTSSSKSLRISVELKEEKNFFVELNKTYSLSVSPSESRYVFYKFDSNTSDTVVVEVESDDEKCLIVSVQDSKCPVFDLNKDIKYEGIYETINTKGAITLARRRYVGGFFLVFVAKPDNYECSQRNSYIPRLTRPVFHTTYRAINASNIKFKVRNGITAKNYAMAITITIAILLVVALLILFAALISHRYGTISKRGHEDVDVQENFMHVSKKNAPGILRTIDLNLSLLAGCPDVIKRRSYNYLWHTLSIAIFYSIPVVQLVFTYQRIVNKTGDEDMCYYNFLCAHPLLGFSDFNHIYSNLGYVIFGILFICVVVDRHRLIKIRKIRGIPVHYGLFHAMGVALIIEGLLSACYHICPSQTNYQFDTSFMYVMAVLSMVKLYQNRHPEINATAYTTFTILGLAIFMAMIGILNGDLVIWITFVICYSILVVILSFKIYFLNYVIIGLNEFRTTLTNGESISKAIMPIRKTRFLLLVLANVANYSMLVVGLLLYNSNFTDFGTFLLGLLMGNAIIHTVFYTSMKLVNHEKMCPEAICYGLLSIGVWVWSSIYFFDAATLWTVTPAESRQWNQDCVLFEFFDKHDVWHLLSAPALYFTFMYLMVLDDDIIDKKHMDIPVF
ncbi:unnamed protein product [Phyllotreta striolata]|uniref:SID1 transmembrane family member 1 n=1 Tax=Phyllotreta striolata TaxID=444603 RepID=A0A9N9TEU4_PHYSR|nr:unnamed protein product [Phyllotreta striolata]